MNMNFDFSLQDKTVINEITPLLDSNSELYIVGGYLRDMYFGKQSFDIDFIVKGQNAIDLARNFADNTNRYFILLDDEFEIARVVDKDKTHYFDFARCENDDINTDISRRDLTINTLCAKVFPDFKVIDKYNSMHDFKTATIKTLSEKNLLDDPLRILRVYRFASLLDFDIDDETLQFTQKYCNLIHNVAKERILTELLKFFEGKNSAKYLDIMNKTGLLFNLFEILKREESIPPNTHHHLALIDHSIETVRQLEMKIENAPDFVQEKLNSYQTNGIKYLSLLKIAALLHDVGKPDTWTIEENGRHRFINHDSVGAELLKPILRDMKFSKAQIKYITTLVKNHIYPSQLAKDNEDATEKVVFRMFRKLENCTVDVLLLAMADRLSAQGPAITKEMTDNNINHLTKYLYMYKDFSENEKPLPKLIDGNEISETFGVKRGKDLGVVIQALKNAQLSGEVTSKEDAINFISKMVVDSRGMSEL